MNRHFAFLRKLIAVEADRRQVPVHVSYRKFFQLYFLLLITGLGWDVFFKDWVVIHSWNFGRGAIKTRLTTTCLTLCRILPTNHVRIISHTRLIKPRKRLRSIKLLRIIVREHVRRVPLNHFALCRCPCLLFLLVSWCHSTIILLLYHFKRLIEIRHSYLLCYFSVIKVFVNRRLDYWRGLILQSQHLAICV